MKRPRNLITLSAICIICMTYGSNNFSSAYAAVVTTNTSSALIDKAMEITCLFTTKYSYDTMRNIYSCEISGRIFITHRGTSINNVKGTHLLRRTASEVLGFKGDASIIHYFPKDVEKRFPNLQAILLNLVQLKEIHQSDLRPFQDLRYLDLFENKLEYLETDLFKYNRKLEVVWLSNNNIKFVDDTVFDGLINLRSIYLAYNGCISQSVADQSRISFFRDLIRIVCGNKSKNAKFDPKNLPAGDTDYDEDDDEEQKQKAENNGLNETEIAIKELTQKLRTVEDEVFQLKRKREQALIWLVQMEDENRALKKSQNDSTRLIQQLQDNVKKAETSGIDYVKQIFGLRDDLRKQTDATNSIVTDIKNQVANDQDRLKSQKDEITKLRDQNTKVLDENQKLRDNYDNLRSDKESRDTASIIVIALLAICIVGIIGFNFYKKSQANGGTGRTYNDFENATMKLVNEGASGSVH